MIDYKQKLQIFFHDPLDKPVNIQNHEQRAAEQLKIMGLNYEKNVEADQIASAADRLNNFQDTEGKTIKIVFDKEGELTHPLGSGRLKLAEPCALGLDDKKINESVRDFIISLKEKYSVDYKKIFLDLWRNFPENIKGFELPNYTIGELWNLFPADSRIPDHSIIHHNLLTTAIHNSLPDIMFGKFSIGPVQDFISTAKRTEDFWMGSYLLSYLISKALIKIIELLGVEHIIFPDVKGQPLIDKYLKDMQKIEISDDYKDKIFYSSLANVVFFICPEKEFLSVINEIEKNIRKEWKLICDKVKIKFNFTDYGNRIFDDQINNFIEFYYAAVKINNKQISEFIDIYSQNINSIKKNDGDYADNIGSYWGEIYDYLDKLFASNKLIRNFKFSEEKGRKCSLCGEHSAISDKEEHSNAELKKYWKELSKKINSFRLDKEGADRLCGICLTKRMALELFFKDYFQFDTSKPIYFPSVSSIAAWPFKLKILEHIEFLSDKIKNYNDILKKLNVDTNDYPYYIKKEIKKIKPKFQEIAEEFMRLDGELVFTDLIVQNKKIDKNSLELIKDFFKEIKKYFEEAKLDIPIPVKYYSIIRLDGDQIGRWLSGTHIHSANWEDVVHSKMKQNLKDKEQLKNKRKISPAVHSFISYALNQYSLNAVKEIVEEKFPGKLIYSGGDDVLAILPLEYALECAEQLRYYFSGNINNKNEIDLKQTNGFYMIDKKIITSLGNNVSMSAGMVFSHIKYNFQNALKKSLYAKNQAKERLDRDAYFIVIIKHSGSEVNFGLKWSNNQERTVKALKKILNLVEEKKVSMNFFTSAYEILSKIGEDEDLFWVLLKKEIKDHLNKEKVDKELEKNLIDEILKIFQFLNSPIINPSNKLEILRNIILGLRFLAAKGGLEK